jgi:hypothetical protein
MFMKGVERADECLAYYSLLRKTVKWTKKVALWLINCALFNSFSVYKNLNPRTKLMYKEFCCEWQKPGLQNRWRRHKQSQTQAYCDPDRRLQLHIGLMWTPQGDFRVICGNVSLRKLWKAKRARGSILLGHAVFAQFTKKGAKRGTFANSV